MHNKTKNIILIPAAIIITAAAITGYVLWNKPHKNIKDAVAAKINAVYLYNLFITDSAKARSLYSDKAVQVWGEIAKVSLNQLSQQIILIKTSVPDGYINCTMEEKTAGLKAGDTIAIKGICSGYISGDAGMDLPGDVFLIRGYPIK